MKRYTRLSDAQVLERLQIVASAEAVAQTDGGLSAVIFTADGDLRQALNNMQATFYGFGVVNEENVFKVSTPYFVSL
jgi:replication factor C subunit 2/4